MSKKLLGATLMVAILALSGSVFAADLPGTCGQDEAALMSVDTSTSGEECIDLYCEWVDMCRNINDSWSDHWKEERCFTNCGYYWYWTGMKCCWVTVPYTC